MDNGQRTMDNGQRCPQRATSRDSLRPVPVWVPVPVPVLLDSRPRCEWTTDNGGPLSKDNCLVSGPIQTTDNNRGLGVPTPWTTDRV